MIDKRLFNILYSPLLNQIITVSQDAQDIKSAFHKNYQPAGLLVSYPYMWPGRSCRISQN